MTTAEAYLLAQQHHQAGAFSEAVEIYRQILQAEPANTLVLCQLGAAYEALGGLGDAVDCYRRASALEPGRAEIHDWLGLALAKQGHLAEAAATYQRVLQLHPDHVEIYGNLAVVLAAQGEFEQAIACYRRALALRPDHPVLYNNLGIALRYRGELPEAVGCFRRAIAIMPSYAAAHNNLGGALRNQGDLEGAVAAYRQALRLHPDYVDALSNLGAALEDGGETREALACYRRALDLQPDHLVARMNLATALRDQGDVASAESGYRQALSYRPDFAEAHHELASVLQERGKIDESVHHAEEALRLRPNWAPAVLTLADLAVNGHYRFPEAMAERIEALAGDPNLPLDDASQLCFALGNLRERAGAYDDAFASYQQGNALKRRLLHQTGRDFDPDKHDAIIDGFIAAFTPVLVERLRGFGLDTELPVFIVGMPRSGTTVVEQILASHPRVHGAGEIADFASLAAALPSRLGVGEAYPRCIDRLDQPAARAVAEDYVRGLIRRGGPAIRVTDKGLLNYLHLGLFAALFPRARVIHCRRDPRDVCLSCYFQFFRNELNFTWDLGDLGRYYRAYERLMAHWREVLPVQPLELVYEDLAANQEAETRRLLAFCGLEWDSRCLAFHESRRAVQTASKLQVRKPLYTTSVGRWRRYATHLGPLLTALGDDRFSSSPLATADDADGRDARGVNLRR